MILYSVINLVHLTFYFFFKFLSHQNIKCLIFRCVIIRSRVSVIDKRVIMSMLFGSDCQERDRWTDIFSYFHSLQNQAEHWHLTDPLPWFYHCPQHRHLIITRWLSPSKRIPYHHRVFIPRTSIPYDCQQIKINISHRFVNSTLYWYVVTPMMFTNHLLDIQMSTFGFCG